MARAAKPLQLTLALCMALIPGCMEPGEPDAHDVAQTSAALSSSDVVGSWYVWANNFRCEVKIWLVSGLFNANMTCEGAATDVVDNVSVSSGWLEFRRVTNGSTLYQWFRMRVNQGVATGRFSSLATAPKPALTSYAYHVTGWRAESFAATTPIAFELENNVIQRAKLRIDAVPGQPNTYAGRFKVWFGRAGAGTSPAGEELEYDVNVTKWDGVNLKFTRTIANVGVESHDLQVSGRHVTDTSTLNGQQTSWTGVRAEVLGYGFAGGKATPASRLATLRSRVTSLVMDGNPLPTSAAMTSSPATVSTSGPSQHRDDDFSTTAPAYTLTELHFDYTLPDAFSGTSVHRLTHGYLAVPTTPLPPSGRRPAVLAINGHTGSAKQVMAPDNGLFWYGEAFARRGYIVLAIDISHRGSTQPPPPATVTPVERMYGYLNMDYQNGDSPTEGNGVHPPIAAAGFDTNWEEEGERIWDSMRGIDYLVSRADVDRTHVLMTGLSMGGEITTWTAALDTRISMAIPAGYGADLDINILPYGGHHCMSWQWAQVEEYLDTSDIQSLIAPRPFMVITGQNDPGVSSYAPPFASSKQVGRRTRAAYQDLGALGKHVQYLYLKGALTDPENGHLWHAGGKFPAPHDADPLVGVVEPQLYGPSPAQPFYWQTDGSVTKTYPSVFSAISTLLP